MHLLRVVPNTAILFFTYEKVSVTSVTCVLDLANERVQAWLS